MNEKQNHTRARVMLLVEDNRGESLLMIESLKEHRAVGSISVVEDGEEAMAFLRREGIYSNAPRPDLILLDLNMPRKDGRQVLREIKVDPKLRRIPVIIVSSSDAPEDIAKTYELGANAYLSKPVDLDEFLAMVKSLVSFWLDFAKLPRN